jgi:hypothetical protein
MRINNLFEKLERTGEEKSAVIGWGRGMGHRGHMFLASSVITHANELSADPYFVVSRTVGKDDPITPEEKLEIYKKVFPEKGHIFQTATDEMPDLTRVLSKLENLGYENVTVVVGEDQKKALSYVMNYNGKPDKKGNILYNFKELNVISRQETNDTSKDEEGPRATPMRDILTNPQSSEEEKFKLWRSSMSPELSDQEVKDLMQKASQRMADFTGKKEKVTESVSPSEFTNSILGEIRSIIKEMKRDPYLSRLVEQNIKEGTPVNVDALLSRSDHSGSGSPWWARAGDLNYMGNTKGDRPLQYKVYFPNMFSKHSLDMFDGNKEKLIKAASELRMEQDDNGDWFYPVYRKTDAVKHEITRAKYLFGDKIIKKVEDEGIEEGDTLDTGPDGKLTAKGEEQMRRYRQQKREQERQQIIAKHTKTVKGDTYGVAPSRISQSRNEVDWAAANKELRKKGLDEQGVAEGKPKGYDSEGNPLGGGWDEYDNDHKKSWTVIVNGKAWKTFDDERQAYKAADAIQQKYGKKTRVISDSVLEASKLSTREKLHKRHQEIRKNSGLPDPDYYKELKTTYDLPDEKRHTKAAELKKKYNVKEADWDQQSDEMIPPEYEMDPDELRSLRNSSVIDDETIEKMIKLAANGVNDTKIADMFNIDKETVAGILDDYIEEIEAAIDHNDNVRESKQPEAPKPRNFVAKNAKTAGAGKHKDAKKAAKDVRGQKHKDKMPLDESKWGPAMKAYTKKNMP